MATTAAKLKAASNDNARTALLAALKFAALALDKDDNSGLAEFVTIRDGLLMTENGTFSIGVPVETPLDMCLHAEKFQAALQQCGQSFQMTQIEAQQLSITSGKFRAIIPILPSDTIIAAAPDVWVADLSDKLNEGFKTVAKFCSGKGDRPIDQGVLLQANSIVATNGIAAIEFWHGINLPPDLMIPKKTIDVLAKIDKPLAGFGFRPEQSVTLYFNDNSLIKTRLFSGAFPAQLTTIFDKAMAGQFVKQWPGFVEALKAVAKFIENDTVALCPGFLATDSNLEHASASYEVEGLPGGHKFSDTWLRLILPHADQIYMPAHQTEPLAFTSANVRGLLMGKR